MFSHTSQEKNSIYKKSLISWCAAECFKLASLLYKHQSQRKELNILRVERSRVQALNHGGSASNSICSGNSNSNINSNSNSKNSRTSNNYKIECFLSDEINQLERAGEELTFQYMKVSNK